MPFLLWNWRCLNFVEYALETNLFLQEIGTQLLIFILNFLLLIYMHGLSWNYQFNKMSFGHVFTRINDAFSFVLISIMTQLYDIFSFVLMYIFMGKKGNERDKEYFLLKHERFCLLFICLCFSLKPNSVLQSILLAVLSHWEKELLFDENPSNTPTEKKPWKEFPKN